MGYDIHITRKTQWFDDTGPEITLDEWLGYVSADIEMRLDGYAEAHTPSGQTIRMDNTGIAVWTAYSGHDVNGNMAWFSHFKNKVTVKNADLEIRQKMYRIASSLSAHVQGDEGEAYGADGEQIDDQSGPQSGGSSKEKSWWQFWQ